MEISLLLQWNSGKSKMADRNALLLLSIVRKALDNIDLNQMSHRYVSGVLQNEPSTSAHLIDRFENVNLS